jgi:hypothetical protein
LEVWCWQWKFAYFCQKMWIKDYTWVEYDNEMARIAKEKFKDYTIISWDIFEYFKKNDEKYDIIFLSHVFEHFDLDGWFKLANQIKEHLNEWWFWLNFMPNIEWLFAGQKYWDITHKQVYSANAFNQVLLWAWFLREKIKHFNVHPNVGFWWFIYKFVYPIRLALNRLLLGGGVEYYTSSFLSVIQK